jgi:hypothetical protein
VYFGGSSTLANLPVIRSTVQLAQEKAAANMDENNLPPFMEHQSHVRIAERDCTLPDDDKKRLQSPDRDLPLKHITLLLVDSYFTQVRTHTKSPFLIRGTDHDP